MSSQIMQPGLTVEVTPAEKLTPGLKAAVLSLCNRAYGEDLAPLFATFTDPVHVLGFQSNVLVSHAMWVTRWLQPKDGPRLRTAYVEMVATEPAQQKQGFATAIMQRLARATSGYDLGALSPADTSVYTRLGWVFWRGPLSIRSGEGWIATPDMQVMILCLPKTPPLNLDQALSAEWRAGELW